MCICHHMARLLWLPEPLKAELFIWYHAHSRCDSLESVCIRDPRCGGIILIASSACERHPCIYLYDSVSPVHKHAMLRHPG